MTNLAPTTHEQETIPPRTAEEDMLRSANWAKAEMAECPGPTEIGNIEISPEELETLRKVFQNKEFGLLQSTGYIQDLKSQESKESDLSLITEAKIILTRLRDQFNIIVSEDLATISDQGPSNTDYTLLEIGDFIETDIDIHVDDPYSPGYLRYGATIAGPPTLWVNETVRTENLASDGEMIDDSEIKEPLVPGEVGKVYRFTKACDPHSTPLSDEPVFRITIFTGTSQGSLPQPNPDYASNTY